MIDVKDLMVGSIVKSNNPKYRPNELGKFLYVTKVDSENDSIGCFVYEELPFAINFGQFTKFIAGIELSEEILLKCGFEKLAFSFNCERFHMTMQDDTNIWFVASNKNNAFVCTISYLHELQQLYKILTKQELEIKL